MVFDADQVTAEVAKGIEKIQNASNLEELKAIKTTYAGADSAMTKASKAIGSLPVDQKKEAGKLMGKLRADFGRAYGPKEVELKEAAEKAALAAETVDMTLPVNRKPLGARHPLPKLMEDVEDFFISMGWQISSGPEIEAEWYNFDSLNFGPDHPARQMQDTFYVKGNQAKDAAGFVGSNMVVRTQTSSDQVRALLTRGVPLYIASPGRVFRTDELDATHTPVFHQCEALAVDKHLTMAERRARPVVPRQEGRPRLARVGRLRHGEPERAEVRRHRPGRLHRFRLRRRHGAHAPAAQRHQRHARPGRR
mgnify:CR=1 FL=1